jgi:hypothetical protein
MKRFGGIILFKLIVVTLATVLVTAVISVFVIPRTARSVLVLLAHGLANPMPTVKADEPKVFVASQICEWGVSGFSADTCGIEPLYTVQQNKIAVIDSVSGLCVVTPPNTIREFQFQYTGPDGTPAQLSFPPSPAVQNASNFFSVSITALNLKTYASGGSSGTPINFLALANAVQPTAYPGYFCHLTVSGHYD